jgi:hypothetical protein
LLYFPIIIHFNLSNRIRQANICQNQKVTQAYRRYHLVTANGDTINVRGTALIEIKIGTLVISRKLIVVDGFPEELVIMGNDIFGTYLQFRSS